MSFAKAIGKMMSGAATSVAMKQIDAKYAAAEKKAARNGGDDGGTHCSPCAAQGYLDAMRKQLGG